MNVHYVEFEPKGDNRGKLIAIESGKNIPFNIKRVFYIYNTKENVARAKHANVRTKQVIVCFNGRCKILVDDGKERKYFDLDRPERGLFIGPMIWRAILHISRGSVILVLTDDYYDPQEYIRDYGEFRRMALEERR